MRTKLKELDTNDHKIAVWNAFVDSELSGVTDDDAAILPRVLPASYLPVIRRTALDITTFAMRLLSLPVEEIRALLPRGPVRDFLIDELEVLRFRPRRLTGSFRFDMAIVGAPAKTIHRGYLRSMKSVSTASPALLSFKRRCFL